MNGIFYQIDLLGSAVDATEKNHRVVSQNIANVNTPGYQTKRLDFQKMLEQSQAASQENVTDRDPELPVELPEGLTERLDGNNVNLEQEVAQLKKNALAFQTYSQLLASRITTMRRAISG
ncbi:flagellar basal body rod protein FlgB [Roseiconus lacunae]|uniref:Flagellar basal body rod protein FlgB n=1 Tax=Roseiconus lacunae TaxID=2605694 RepID=A0ABT7PDF2_9BACT|nr:flagellar basal body rod protein FlgB [Roseiconus lacunae]MCD0459821.1 flagellar basal body rod protein FlgB [Roseiconus lacunae]MDM4014519.1 flagellar basal body rod protein FlgB [Roseiconus lacunae]